MSTLRVPPEKSDLIQALARTGEEIERMAGLNFSIVVTGSPRDLHPVVREEAYWIGRKHCSTLSTIQRAGRLKWRLRTPIVC